MQLIVMGWRNGYPKRRQVGQIYFKEVSELPALYRQAVCLLDAAKTDDSDIASVWNVGIVHKDSYRVEESYLRKEREPLKVVREYVKGIMQRGYFFNDLEDVRPEHRAAVAMLDACAACNLAGVGYVVRTHRSDVYILDKTHRGPR